MNRGIARLLLKAQRVGTASTFSRSLQPLSRSFSAASTNVVEKKEQVAEAPTLKGLINKFGGVYPLGALAVIAAVSKEVVLIDAELLMAADLVLMGTAAYIMLGDTIYKSLREPVEADLKINDDLNDLQLDALGYLKKTYEGSIAQVDIVKQYITEYNSSLVGLHDYKQTMVRLHFRNAMEKKLQDIKAQEDNRLSVLKKLMAIKSTEYVRSAFAKASPQLRADVINNAINDIGGTDSTRDARKDPIKSLYLEFIDKTLPKQK